MTSTSPLLERCGAEPLALHGGAGVSVDAFLDDVAGTAAALPQASLLINVCEQRYRFMVAFFAAVLGGRTNLLPATRTPQALDQLARRYPGALPLDDRLVSGRPATPDIDRCGDTHIDDARPAAIAFTSGSTGEPQPNAKYWGTLRRASRQHAAQLDAGAGTATIVATVPPWHMYGLEWSVLIAAVAPLTVYCGETFYPDDVRRGLAAADGRRILVTTPIHLRALLRSGSRYPAVDTIVCATAPLELELAREAEDRLGARLLEIYGCTEAGTLAHRWPTRDAAWRLFPGFELTVEDERAWLRGEFLAEPLALADRIDVRRDGTFDLLGRWGDLVKVGGKRASLADLTARLLAVPGVEDGVMVAPGDDQDSERLCAVVVAPGLTAESVRRRLAEVLEPAFMPRPLRLVSELPRTRTGKLTRQDLQTLLDDGDGGPL
ncbi:MAG: AMP-binding protein [Gammaproteobacteria bacterium]|nr:AMP-binding protein [Gammaproteobacteria bacterium]